MKSILLHTAVLVTLLWCVGCLSLSPEERRRLSELDELGYSLDMPPAGFSVPMDEMTVAGLNLLPGIGNDYLACKGAGESQWVLGLGNLLLWPVSPLWAVPEGYFDARTLNRRALASYWGDHPEIAKSNDSPAGADSARDYFPPRGVPRLAESSPKTEDNPTVATPDTLAAPSAPDEPATSADIENDTLLESILRQ